MKGLYKVTSIFVLAAMLLAMPGYAQPVQAVAPEVPAVQAQVQAASTWCVAGDHNGWNNSSDPLYDDGTHGDVFPGDGIYSLSYTVAAAGTHEWKVVKCGDWGTTIPSDNSWFVTATADQEVLFTLDTNDHSGDVGLNLYPRTNIVNVWDSANDFTAVGDFNGWTNDDAAAHLTYVGNGFFRYEFVQTTAGTYAGKVVRTGTWNAFGASGRSVNSGNLSYTTTSDGQSVVVLVDARSGRMAFLPQTAGAGTWCATGINNWNANDIPLYDDGTHGDLSGGDGVFSADLTIATTGRYDWKVTVCDWSNSFPGSGNSFLRTSTDNQTVKLTFDTNNHAADVGLPMLPAQNILNAWDNQPAGISVVGDFNSWNNNDPTHALADLGNGYYFLAALMTPGSHMGKLTTSGTWDAWGSDGRGANAININFNAYYADQPVYFLLDYFTGRSFVYAAPPTSHALDNLVETNGLKHDSQDDLYRAPFGAQPVGTTVYLRFRTFHNDVESVRVRFYDTTLGGEFYDDMFIAGSGLPCDDPALSHDTCDYWQVPVNRSTITNLYYRFIVKDGTDTAYYADSNMKDGGLGEASDAMVDNSYEITYYHPTFTVIPWMQNAVIYQIFPDRFYNGDKSNDPTGEEPHYGFPGNLADQIVHKLWDSLPEGFCRGYVGPAVACDEAPAGRDYYGGDLQGVMDKLDYLQALGVTVIYFNPVFDAGSNHGYDTQDYLNIEPFFGTNADFEQLAAEADARGIHIVLDGVFNHVSSDSPYFDRYSHYPDSIGACESLTSPYRDWFYFTPVAPGTGKCAGILGANSANYDSWWGFDSIPVMDKSNAEVQNLLLYGNGTTEGVTSFWLNEGSSGWRLDVMNDSTFPADFWQNFRAIVKGVNPEAVIIGELWKKGDVLPMVLGDTADTAMNYRFRNAVQGLLGTIDGKGFPDDGQSNQPPSTFAKKMISMREDYPDATYYTLMNLLGTHDTERILWGMTPGEDNREQKEFNAANLAVGIQRLKLAAVIQMTVPGAPTIYYGDEVGVTGYDDPDDRRSFPWMDNFYFLPFVTGDLSTSKLAQAIFPQSTVDYYGAAGNHDLLDHYRNLTAIRHANPVFSQGKLTFLLTDDANNTLAYLLRTDDAAALVAINKSDTLQTLTIDTNTYLPSAYELEDALGTLAGPVYGVDGLVSFDLPAMSAAILLPAAGQNLVIPAARIIEAAYPYNGSVEVSFPVIIKAGETIAVYRSYFTGGGYQLLDLTTDEVYTDTSVTNGLNYYYVIRTIDADGNYSAYSPEVHAMPYYPIGWAGNLSPATMTYTITSLPSAPISAEIWIDGLTNADGNESQIQAQIGYGPTGTLPVDYQWQDIAFDHRNGNNYVFSGTIRPETVGSYDYLIRFSTTHGLEWSYAYVTGTQVGVATVEASTDTTAPEPPTNLIIANYGADFIDLAWTASVATDVAEYWVYRYDPIISIYQRIAVVDASTLTYHDANVVSGYQYTYYIIAADTSLNLSGLSNYMSQTAQVKMIQVTFVVQVPAGTPVTDLIYITGDTAPLQWDPSARPMIPTGTPGLWISQAEFPEGATVQYKYARGSWDRVEWWGSITETANRSFVVDGGGTTYQTVDNTSSDPLLTDSEKAPQAWRDPLVVNTHPGNTEVLPDNLDAIHIGFNVPIKPLAGGDFSTSVVVKINNVDYTASGTITQDAFDVLSWTPTSPYLLPIGIYTVTVNNLRRDGDGDIPMQSSYTFTFVVPPK